jgi:hypothetical protein
MPINHKRGYTTGQELKLREQHGEIAIKRKQGVIQRTNGEKSLPMDVPMPEPTLQMMSNAWSQYREKVEKIFNTLSNMKLFLDTGKTDVVASLADGLMISI